MRCGQNIPATFLQIRVSLVSRVLYVDVVCVRVDQDNSSSYIFAMPSCTTCVCCANDSSVL